MKSVLAILQESEGALEGRVSGLTRRLEEEEGEREEERVHWREQLDTLNSQLTGKWDL